MLLTTVSEYDRTLLPKKMEKAIAETLEILEENGYTLQIGTYELSNFSKAIVSEYETKEFDNCPYETHKYHADIQMLISGEEYLDIRPKEGLTPMEEHSDTRNDLVLYSEKLVEHARVHLMPGVICVISPNEAHAPSICVGNPSKVHKVVIKVPFE